MKKLVLAVFLAHSVSAPAQVAEYFEWDNPTAKFDATKRNFNVVQVEWRAVDDVRDYCSKLNVSRGYPPITNTNIKACGTQDGNKCLIVTAKQASMHNLGHELRHCFQGYWHSQ
jgi:sulfur relay (sulfurtransferase) DsrC/TusE family protein